MSYGRHPLNPIPLLLFAALPPPPPLPPLGRAGKKAFFSLHGNAKQPLHRAGLLQVRVDLSERQVEMDPEGGSGSRTPNDTALPLKINSTSSQPHRGQ